MLPWRLVVLVYDVRNNGNVIKSWREKPLNILCWTSYVFANVCEGTLLKLDTYRIVKWLCPWLETTIAQAWTHLTLSHKTKSRALNQMACVPLMRAADALTCLHICLSLFDIHSTKRNTNVWYADSNGDILLYMRGANGSDESAHLHRIAWALITRQGAKYQAAVLTQTVIWVPFMLAAQALASLGIALAHLSLHHRTKSEYTDESAPETSAMCNLRCVVSISRICACSPEHSLLENATSIKITWQCAVSNKPSLFEKKVFIVLHF